MLVSLSIRDLVLIDRLDLTFDRGLCVLTGETGAGKSILLDALGLALGARADHRLVRPGAAHTLVTAAFDVADGHPATAVLADHGLAPDDGSLVLRRTVGAEVRSRAFVNDQPVSLRLLRALGDCLVEVQGRFEQRGLFDPERHRQLLDSYARLGADRARVAALWRGWRQALDGHAEAARRLAQSRQEEGYLRHALAEIDGLDPQPGETDALAQRRSLLRHREQLIEAVDTAVAELTGAELIGAELAGGKRGAGAEAALGAARRSLERLAEHAGGRLQPALGALERAAAEIQEALGELNGLTHDLDLEPGRLAEVEERYFALLDLARKHGIEADRLAELREDLAARLGLIDDGGERLDELERAAAAARTGYLKAARALGVGRRRAARALERAVNAELPPLKLDKASFHGRVEGLDEPQWGANGLDRIGFEVTTNPGAAAGPLGRIASAGELSRFLLALKVVLAEVNPGQSLVFDEVDSGIGGATAHAVGERLAGLARDRQILVVTHSPQVAARATHHWRVAKQSRGKQAVTRVDPLSAPARREEIARMLSGAEITDEARAAAERLMGAA